MENICETERLSCIRNEMTHLWGGVFATAGGSIALSLSELSTIKIIFIILGFFSSIVMTNAYFVRRMAIAKIIKSMEVQNGTK